MNLFWVILCAVAQLITCILLKNDSFNPVFATMIIFAMSVFTCKFKFLANVLAVVLVVGMFLGFWGLLFGAITTFNGVVIGFYLVSNVDCCYAPAAVGCSRSNRKRRKRQSWDTIKIQYRGNDGRIRSKKYKRVRNY